MTCNEFRIDLHVHSQLSGDNAADPEECVARAIERGLQGIAFTEHYSYGISEPVEELARRYRDSILVVRGVEFSTAEGHCLVFGADTDRLCSPYTPAAELVRLVGERGGVVVPSHPYRGGSGLGDRILSLPGIAALEGHNGCNAGGLNRRAIDAARRLGLPVTGGSDAHRPEDVGDCYTRFRCRVTGDNLVALLRAGDYEGVDTRRASAGLFRLAAAGGDAWLPGWPVLTRSGRSRKDGRDLEP